MKVFRASQSSVVHIEAVLTSNQYPVWPAKIFKRLIDGLSGLQALFFTVVQTPVDLLCKKSYKSSSLLGYFHCFLSNHIVGCCNINFSCQSQKRIEGNILLCKQCLCIFVVLFSVTAVVLMPRLAKFSPCLAKFSSCDPYFFCFRPTLYTQSLLKNAFFQMFMGNYWERNREREMFRLNRFPIIEAKSYFFALSCDLNPTFFSQFPLGIIEKHAKKKQAYCWLEK